MRVLNEQGLDLDFDGLIIGLDSFSSNSDLIFLSHAHTDHLVKRTSKPVLSSDLTANIALHRVGFEYNLLSGLPGLELVDSGHVIGSKSLIVNGDETLFYTGDFSVHNRLFLNGLKPINCDTLIIETTYGLPQYDFGDPNEIIAEARDVIADDLAHGYDVCLWGYALGKAQVLTKLADGLGGDLFANSKVRVINDVCRQHGCDLPLTKPFSGDSGVYITSSRKELVDFDRAYSFTGWGARGVTDCFKLSDHASFTDLLWFVKQCNPDKVLTHHGFSEEFASLLRVEGFDAQPI